MGAIIVQTDRLVCREFETADVEPLYAIVRDPMHMRFTFTTESRVECAAWLQRHASARAVHGFAPWTAVQRSRGEVVGWGGPNVDPDVPGWGPEVTYFIHPSYAGRGFATELVRASLEVAFGHLGLPRMRAFTRPANVASARVLTKCGFARVRYEPALERDRYEVRRQDWGGTLGDGATIVRDAGLDEIEDVRRLFREYQAEIGVDLCFQDFADELATLPGRYAAPGGRLSIAITGPATSGCGAMRALGSGACEIKRLYVRRPFRGRGLGRLLAGALIRSARDTGYERMFLDTLASMHEARALYRSLGFADVAAYYDNPHPGAMYLALELRPSAE